MEPLFEISFVRSDGQTSGLPEREQSLGTKCTKIAKFEYIKFDINSKNSECKRSELLGHQNMHNN